jgi:hypothetical protein
VYQLSIDGGPTSFPPLKTEAAPKAESWGESLARQIHEQVQQDIERSMTGKRPESESTRETLGDVVQLVLLAAAIIVIVLLVKLVF